MLKGKLVNAAILASALTVANTAAAWTVKHDQNSVDNLVHKASLPSPSQETIESPFRKPEKSIEEINFAKKHLERLNRVHDSLVLQYRQKLADIENERLDRINATWQSFNSHMVNDYLDRLPFVLPEIDSAILEDVISKTQSGMVLRNASRDMDAINAYGRDYSKTIYGETGKMVTGILEEINPDSRQVVSDVTGSLAHAMVNKRHDGFLVERFLYGMQNEFSDLDKSQINNAVKFVREHMGMMNLISRKDNSELSDDIILKRTANMFIDQLVEKGFNPDIIKRAKVASDENIKQMLDEFVDPGDDIEEEPGVDFAGKSSRSGLSRAMSEKDFGSIEDPFEKARSSSPVVKRDEYTFEI